MKEKAPAVKQFSRLVSSQAVLLVSDLMIGGIAYWAAWLLRIYVSLPFTQALLPQERWDSVSHYWFLLILSQLFFLYIFGMYDDLRILRYRELVVYTFLACMTQVVALTSVFYLTNEVFPRTVVLLFGVLNWMGLSSLRSLLKTQLHRFVRRVLIVGEDLESTREIVADIERSPWMGMKVVGVLAGGNAGTVSTGTDQSLGRLEEAREIVNKFEVDEIIFASRQTWKDKVLDSLSNLQVERPLRIAIQPSVYEIAIGRLRHINIHDTPLIDVRRNPNEPLQRLAKRSFDLFFSSFGLLLLAPVFVLIGIGIKVSSPGPVFYLQERVGRGGKVFRVVKFRTMVPDAEKESGERYAEENDPRVTGIGSVLRRFRLDELPQFVNVLVGEMSFVGPRPERPGFVKDLSSRITGYNERLKVKPGITGLAQVRGFYDTTPEKKLKYDLAYIYNYGFSLDLMIILETLKTILIRKGS